MRPQTQANVYSWMRNTRHTPSDFYMTQRVRTSLTVPYIVIPYVDFTKDHKSWDFELLDLITAPFPENKM